MPTPPVTLTADRAAVIDVPSGELDCWTATKLASALDLSAATAQRRAGRWPAVDVPGLGPRYPLAWVRDLIATALRLGIVNVDDHARDYIASHQPAGDLA